MLNIQTMDHWAYNKFNALLRSHLLSNILGTHHWGKNVKLNILISYNIFDKIFTLIVISKFALNYDWKYFKPLQGFIIHLIIFTICINILVSTEKKNLIYYNFSCTFQWFWRQCKHDNIEWHKSHSSRASSLAT